MSGVDSSDFLNRISWFTSHHSLTYRVPAISGEEDGVVTQYVDVFSLLPHPRDLQENLYKVDGIFTFDFFSRELEVKVGRLC